MMIRRRRIPFRCQVESLEVRRVPTMVQLAGQAQWFLGADAHPIPDALVTFYEGPTHLATSGPVWTDLSGHYKASVSLTISRGILPTIRVVVASESHLADVVSSTNRVYDVESTIPLTSNQLSTSRVQLNVSASTDAEDRAFSVLAAMEEAGQYVGSLMGKMPRSLKVYLDPSITGSETAKGGPSEIAFNSAFDWDEIQHEYGHYFEDIAHFADVNNGPEHSFGTHEGGDVQSAFSEGYADFFPIAVQTREIAQPYAMNLQAAGVGDSSYRFPDGTNYDLATNVGVGEDNEISTASFLYHLMVGDQGIQVSDLTMYHKFSSAHVTSIGQAWGVLGNSQSIPNRIKLGTMLGKQNVAPVELTPADQAFAGTPPEFTWDLNGAGAVDSSGRSEYYLDSFAISFYTTDYHLIQTIQVPSSGFAHHSTSNFTPTAAQWAAITEKQTAILWVVEGKSTSHHTPAGPIPAYWSQANTIQLNLPIKVQTLGVFVHSDQASTYFPDAGFAGWVAILTTPTAVPTTAFQGTIDWGDGTVSNDIQVYVVPPSRFGIDTYVLFDNHIYKSTGPSGTPAARYTIKFKLQLQGSAGSPVTGTTTANVSN